MKIIYFRKTYSALALLFLAFLLFFSTRDALARLVWNKYLLADVALYLNRKDPNLFMRLGDYYFGGTKYDLGRAEYAYEKAISLDQKILWGHYQLARIHFINAKFAQAHAEIGKELEANPANLRSLYVRGLIYGYQGRFDRAEEDFRRFVSWAPKEWAGYNDLAWVLLKMQKYQEAEKVINDGIDQAMDGKTNPWLWNALGVARLNLKNHTEAAHAFEKAKKYSAELSVEDWKKSYPGNHPSDALSGLTQFKEGIEKNLMTSKEKGNISD